MNRNLRITGSDLAAALKAAKPHGRARIARASRQDRTYRGVVYDSSSEMRYAQACDAVKLPYEFHKKFQIANSDGVIMTEFEVDFFHAPDLVVEIKSMKRDQNGRVHGYWSEASKLRWRMFRDCYPQFKCRVLAWDRGRFVEVKPK